MPSFRSPLRFEDSGGLPFTLLEPLIYEGSKRVVRVPAGFKTDLASVPRVLWVALPPVGGYDGAAVIHDYLYVTNGLSRGEADSILLEAMEVLGVSWITRHTIYWGVRAGGWKPWGRYRSEQAR